MTVRPSNQMAASDSSAYTLPNVAQAILETAKAPARAFPDIAPSPPGVLAPVGSILLVAATMGLIGQPAALAAALTGLGRAQRAVPDRLSRWPSPPSRIVRGVPDDALLDRSHIGRHASAESSAWTIWRGPVSMARYPCCWGILMVTGIAYTYGDFVHEESGSKALGRFLRQPSRVRPGGPHRRARLCDGVGALLRRRSDLHRSRAAVRHHTSGSSAAPARR